MSNTVTDKGACVEQHRLEIGDYITVRVDVYQYGTVDVCFLTPGYEDVDKKLSVAQLGEIVAFVEKHAEVSVHPEQIT